MKNNEIDIQARKINSNNDVRQKAIRAHGALISYFDGEDPTGTIKSATSDVYAAFISVLTDSGIPGYRKRSHKSREKLRKELESAFKEAGFVNSTGEVSIPGRDDYNEIPSSSVGPLLPGIVAILEIEYGIDSTEAVRQYRPKALDTILPDEEGERTSKTDEQQKTDWKTSIRNAPGFDPNADAYVYVLKLQRRSDSSTWFYVGKRESGFAGLVARIQNHARDFNQSRVVFQEEQEILLGDYNASMARRGTTHDVVDIERLVPIMPSELSKFDKPGAESCYISEVERRTAYEVAIDHETTNVLGGK